MRRHCDDINVLLVNANMNQDGMLSLFQVKYEYLVIAMGMETSFHLVSESFTRDTSLIIMLFLHACMANLLTPDGSMQIKLYEAFSQIIIVFSISSV